MVARYDPGFFRRIVDFSRDRYEEDRATYHVHATNASVPPPADVPEDHDLVGLYLEHWDDVPQNRGFTQSGRQILHCTFGSVMSDQGFSEPIRKILREHPDDHREILTDHFGRHLTALNQG